MKNIVTLTSNTKLEVKPTDKVCFITVNTYQSSGMSLGSSPLTDAALVYDIYDKRDYKTFLLLDSTQSDYVKWLLYFTSIELQDLVLYYSGHGTQVAESKVVFDYKTQTNIPNEYREKDGRDECLIFKGGKYMVDNEITNIIKNNKCKNVLMLFDCCKSGTLLDYVPQNTTIITGCLESGVSYQTEQYGLFTYWLNKLQTTELTNLVPEIIKKLSWTGQKPTIEGTSRQYLYL